MRYQRVSASEKERKRIGGPDRTPRVELIEVAVDRQVEVTATGPHCKHMQ